MQLDWPTMVSDLEQLLKLRTIPFGMKLFESRAEMEAIPRIRRPQHVHTLDQVVGQASRLSNIHPSQPTASSATASIARRCTRA